MGRARPRPSLPSGELGPPGDAGIDEECYLVDPASSHMLVSKIKPQSKGFRGRGLVVGGKGGLYLISCHDFF